MGFWRSIFSLLTLMSLGEENHESAAFFGVMTDMEDRKNARDENIIYDIPVYTQTTVVVKDPTYRDLGYSSKTEMLMSEAEDCFWSTNKGNLAVINKGLRMYEEAGRLGEKRAYEKLGELYYEGIYVTKDYHRACDYFIKADGVSPMSVYYLGEMYNEGRYVEANRKKAKEYFRKAKAYEVVEDEDEDYIDWAEDELESIKEDEKWERECRRR